MKIEEFRKLEKRRPRIRVAAKEDRTADGILFASKREMDRYLVLKDLREAGAVRWFIRQPSFDLPGGVRYRADFLVVWSSGDVTVEDAKGMRTEIYKLKKRQVEALYGIEIREL